MNKAEIISKLKNFKYDLNGFWLITGAALVLYGIREETGDIDMGCTTEAADRMQADGLFYRTTDDENRWFKIDCETEVFENWLFDSVETVEGIPVMSLKGIREMKLLLRREKDLNDIRLIDEYLSRTDP